jgi:hypothetical protein
MNRKKEKAIDEQLLAEKERRISNLITQYHEKEDHITKAMKD